MLVAARAVQGVGGAIITPLTLTILSAAVPAEKRGVALGAWGGIGGLAVALGPLVGGAVVSGLSWQWIFWINVPIGLVLIPLALRRLDETHGPSSRLDLPGLGLVSAGLLGIVWGLVRGNGQGWSSPRSSLRSSAAPSSSSAFVLWELRTEAPMLPMRFFRNRTFALTNVASLLMFFGMFGSIFLLAQFFQTVQGYSPFRSGLRILPWTAMPIFVAPIAGALSDRIGGQPAHGRRARAPGDRPRLDRGGLDADGAVRRRWSRRSCSPGSGWALFFAPVANVVLSSVGPQEEGQASGANNAIRELGGVFGVAVLASVFAHYGGYELGADVRRRDDAGGLGRRGRRRARRGGGVRDPGAAGGRRRSGCFEPALDEAA